MKKSSKRRNTINILILLGIVAGAGYFTTKHTNAESDKKTYPTDRMVLISLLAKSTTVQNTMQLYEYADSCSFYLKHCTADEIDSLKSFVPFYLKFSEDVSHDIINSIRDSGAIDTTTILSPTSAGEVKELSILTNISYATWLHTIYQLAERSQAMRNSMPDGGASKENTNAVRMKIYYIEVRTDSIFRLFSRRLFEKKN